MRQQLTRQRHMLELQAGKLVLTLLKLQAIQPFCREQAVNLQGL